MASINPRDVVPVRFRRLRPGAELPRYQSAGAAGMDLAACLDGPIDLAPGDIAIVPCGFAMALPEGFEAQVRPRSGLAAKRGVTVPNAPGTIDSDYRGEVCVALINLGREAFRVEPGMRIAQMVVAPVSRARFVEVDALDGPDPEVGPGLSDHGARAPEIWVRGAGGFGSTGLGGSGAASAVSPGSRGAAPDPT